VRLHQQQQQHQHHQHHQPLPSQSYGSSTGYGDHHPGHSDDRYKVVIISLVLYNIVFETRVSIDELVRALKIEAHDVTAVLEVTVPSRARYRLLYIPFYLLYYCVLYSIRRRYLSKLRFEGLGRSPIK
jgi:hypothetical protein